MGGVMRARAFAKGLGCELAIIDKRRPKANEAEVMNIIGDVSGKNCVIVDDMIDTAKTLCKAAEALKNRGAKQVYAYATHAIFSGEAIERVEGSIIDELVVTDTIPLTKSAKNVRVVSIAELVAETIRRINNEESISLLLND
jgi:ribose-phosphate pyrophosphokinase